jgi:hypothetical protein
LLDFAMAPGEYPGGSIVPQEYGVADRDQQYCAQREE